ncbi:MAG: aminopeptidase P N-terminal domain-containing protein, partial [Sedimentisphaerales bacterium]|nr:aminopeptidase P N-terminal domain-containing protein [Sedimentisphaerales bacterium]
MRIFDAQTYSARRQILVEKTGPGLILLLGNQLSPINYKDNTYPFRQDSTFLYYVGLEVPDLAVLYDPDVGTWFLFGEDVTLEQSVWTGPVP